MNHDDSERQADRLVAAANPVPDTDQRPELDRVWARIEADLGSGQVVSRPRHRRFVFVGAAVVAAAALTAAAPFIATQTGVWNSPEWVPAGGPGQEYRLDGTDFVAQLTNLGTDIPYPDQASRDRILTNMVEDLTDAGKGEPAAATTGALRAGLARGAICAWSHNWRDADAANDEGRRAASTSALAGALKWSAVTDVDPNPSIDGDETDFGTGPTVFGYLPGIIDAATAGDAEVLASRVDDSAWCVYWDAPVAEPVGGASQPASGEPSTTEAVPTTPPTSSKQQR